ncbi:hypothetical protein LEN26_009804 [Aphanomyces euteiches]|nr:hypothetical protein LEN26_009804 [Aphanomyces euteiches]
MCTRCHEAFCKDCTELIKFDAVDAPQRMCDLCSKVGYCPSVGSADDEELPTRLTEEDLIVPVLDEPIPVSTFPIGESGPAAHFYRTYYQGTPSPPRFPPPSP